MTKIIGVGIAVIGAIVLLGSCSLKQSSAKIFGVAMGEPLSSLKNAKIENRNWVFVSNWYFFDPPEPNNALSDYRAFVTPKYGVCGIMADTNDQQHVSDSDFAVILNAMTAKYGKPIWRDGFGYVWGKPRYLKNYAGVPQADTEPDNPDSTLPDGIRAITLGYWHDGSVEILYQSSDWEDCAKDAQASGL